jgi:hypothetical protein
LQRLSGYDKAHLNIDANSEIVLPCTKGSREYNLPLDLSIDDVAALTQTLMQINSANPSVGSSPRVGEAAIASCTAARLEHKDLETY